MKFTLNVGLNGKVADGDGAMGREGWSIALPSLLTLILLAVGFRLPAMFLLRYGGSPDWSDFRYYHDLAAMVSQGYYPDIHFWVEYPPIFPWIAVGAYRLSLILPPGPQPYFWFDLLLGGVLALGDTAAIWAIDRLGDTLWGKPRGRLIALLYAALFLPTFAILGWFDTLPTALLLVALALIVARRSAFGGAVAGVGIMVKLFPVLALPAALVTRRTDKKGMAIWLDAVVAVGAAILSTLLIAAPFYWRGGATFLATFQNVLARGSWESPWALLDGYYGSGTVASLPDRLFYIQSAAWGTPSHVGLLWDAAAVFVGVIFLWHLRAAILIGTPRAAITLTAFAMTLLVLLSKGFSTQFTEWLLPFIVLLLPNVSGVILAILLTLDDLVLEGYLYVTLFPEQHGLLALSVTIRTFLLLWLAAESAMAIDPKVAQRWAAARRILAWPAAVLFALGLILAAVMIGPKLLAANLQKSGDAPVLAAVNAQPTAAVLFTDPALYDRLYHGVRSHPTAVVAQPKLVDWSGDRSLNQTLVRAVNGRDTVILLTDSSTPPSPLLPAIQTWLAARYGAEPAQKFGSDSLVIYRVSLKPSERSLNQTFGTAITLVGMTPAAPTARPGRPLAVTLHWRANERPAKDYTTSLQLLSPAGKLIAQKDAMPMNNTLPTSGWQPGQDVYDPLALDVPANLPDGDYPLIVVLYDHVTGQRLAVGSADHAALGTVHLSGGTGVGNQGSRATGG